MAHYSADSILRRFKALLAHGMLPLGGMHLLLPFIINFVYIMNMTFLGPRHDEPVMDR